MLPYAKDHLIDPVAPEAKLNVAIGAQLPQWKHPRLFGKLLKAEALFIPESETPEILVTTTNTPENTQGDLLIAKGGAGNDSIKQKAETETIP